MHYHLGISIQLDLVAKNSQKKKKNEKWKFLTISSD